MSTVEKPYRVVSQVHVNEWNEGEQRAVPGWKIRALSIRTGVILDVFVPDARWSAENADFLIRQQLKTVEDIHDLGA